MPREKTLAERPAIFRRTDQGIPELDSETPRRLDSQESRRPDVSMNREARVKATFYLEKDDIVSIDTMQTEEFKRSGKKRERSQIVSQAIREMFERRSV